MMNQGTSVGGMAAIQRILLGVDDKVSTDIAAHSPARDAPHKHVNHEDQNLPCQGMPPTQTRTEK